MIILNTNEINSLLDIVEEMQQSLYKLEDKLIEIRQLAMGSEPGISEKVAPF